MLAYTSLLAAAATTLLTLTAAAPSTVPPTGVIHRITAGVATGNLSLTFSPDNVVAEIGDYIEFHFNPKNHSIVQSSFDRPCEPLQGGIFSGFNFATQNGTARNVFSFQVLTKEPFWYYCSQTVGRHCQMGMVGVVNQNVDSGKTLEGYRARAREALTVQAAVDPLAANGGAVLPNTFLG
jgi:plastocyanin